MRSAVAVASPEQGPSAPLRNLCSTRSRDTRRRRPDGRAPPLRIGRDNQVAIVVFAVRVLTRRR